MLQGTILKKADYNTSFEGVIDDLLTQNLITLLELVRRFLGDWRLL